MPEALFSFERFTNGNKQWLAATAWEGFLNYGSCGVVIKVAEIKNLRRDPKYVQIPVHYAFEGGELFNQLKLQERPEILKAIQTYNPEKEVLLLLVNETLAIVYYRWETPQDALPNEAYERWRKIYPIGVRLNPDYTQQEHLHLLIQQEKKSKKLFESEKIKMLKDSSLQVSFLGSLIKNQAELKQELYELGVDIDDKGDFFTIKNHSPKPSTPFSRLTDYAKFLDYLTITTALNQAMQVYEEQRKKPNWIKEKDKPDWIKKIALTAFVSLDDKVTSGIALFVSMEWDTQAVEEDIHIMFLLWASARIWVRMKKYPRLVSALKEGGKTLEQGLSEKLLSAVLEAGREFINLPHSPSENDSPVLLRLVESIIEKDEAIHDHIHRIQAQRTKRQKATDIHIEGLRAIGVLDITSVSISDTNQRSFEEEFIGREEAKRSLDLLNEGNLSKGQLEYIAAVKSMVFQNDKTPTSEEIAKHLGKQQSTVRVVRKNIRDKHDKLIRHYSRQK